MKTLTIATPCYNESESLPDYLKKMDGVLTDLDHAGWKTELVLINDGSVDNTEEIIQAYVARRENARLVNHPKNSGYGAAIKTAFREAKTDWLIFVDADSNYDQRLILEMVKKLDDSVDILNVSIFAPGGKQGYAASRKLFSSGATLLYRLFFPRLTRGLYTMTCGFRAYRVSVVSQIFPDGNDFFATTEIILRAKAAKLKVVEFPATNFDRDHGVSKMRVVRNTLGHFKLALSAFLFGFDDLAGQRAS